MANGKGNDVPVAIGWMGQENDIYPGARIEDYNEEEYNSYILQRFAAWGESFGQQVLNMYPYSSFNASQLAYEVCILFLFN